MITNADGGTLGRLSDTDRTRLFFHRMRQHGLSHDEIMLALKEHDANMPHTGLVDKYCLICLERYRHQLGSFNAG